MAAVKPSSSGDKQLTDCSLLGVSVNVSLLLLLNEVHVSDSLLGGVAVLYHLVRTEVKIKAVAN